MIKLKPIEPCGSKLLGFTELKCNEHYLCRQCLMMEVDRYKELFELGYNLFDDIKHSLNTGYENDFDDSLDKYKSRLKEETET